MSILNTNCEKQTIINQLFKVQANVTITPEIKGGIPKIVCHGSEVKPSRDCDENNLSNYRWGKKIDIDNKCTFTLTQIICAEIPLSIDVNVDVNSGVVDCHMPNIGQCRICPSHTDPCHIVDGLNIFE
ncbi:MAG: hypothetical protein ACOX4U_03430 [Anaerovoracaceae bacterium]